MYIFSKTLFMMATFSQCFSDEIPAEKTKCPNNASCSSSYGMCVCLPDYYKNHTTCVSHNRHSMDEDDILDFDISEGRQRTNKSHKTESLSTPLPVQVASKTIPEKAGAQSKVADEQRSGTETSATGKITISTKIRTTIFEVTSTTMRSKRGKGEIYPLRGSSVTSDYFSWQARLWRSVN